MSEKSIYLPLVVVVRGGKKRYGMKPSNEVNNLKATVGQCQSERNSRLICKLLRFTVSLSSGGGHRMGIYCTVCCDDT